MGLSGGGPAQAKPASRCPLSLFLTHLLCSFLCSLSLPPAFSFFSQKPINLKLLMSDRIVFHSSTFFCLLLAHSRGPSSPACCSFFNVLFSWFLGVLGQN